MGEDLLRFSRPIFKKKKDQDNKYLLTCQDNLSKYLIAVPIKDQTANEVAKQLVEKIITNFWNS